MAGPRHDPALYRDRDLVRIRRALVSVSDKSELIPFAQALAGAGVEIVSTGSTAARIREAGLDVTDVSAVTGFPESLDGRVKTLHPGVHAGLLADLRLEDHERQLAALDIDPFELVVVNLYPFVETVASGAPSDEIVEQIDIGGPAMVRASAKNFANVAIVVSPSRTPRSSRLSARAERASRSAASSPRAPSRTPRSTIAPSRRGSRGHARRRRPAGSPHDQGGAPRDAPLRRERPPACGDLHARRRDGIAQATQLQGKEMSYNNYVDADAALRAAFDLVKPAVAIIKHANPCGIAVAAPQALDPIASAHCAPTRATPSRPSVASSRPTAP